MYYRKFNFLFVCLILCITFQLLTVSANVQETNEQQSQQQSKININGREFSPEDLASYIHVDPKDLPTPYYELKEKEDAIKAQLKQTTYDNGTSSIDAHDNVKAVACNTCPSNFQYYANQQSRATIYCSCPALGDSYYSGAAIYGGFWGTQMYSYGLINEPIWYITTYYWPQSWASTYRIYAAISHPCYAAMHGGIISTSGGNIALTGIPALNYYVYWVYGSFWSKLYWPYVSNPGYNGIQSSPYMWYSSPPSWSFYPSGDGGNCLPRGAPQPPQSIYTGCYSCSQIAIYFSAPSWNGGSAITNYYACAGGYCSYGTSSPIVVNVPTYVPYNYAGYTVYVYAINNYGWSGVAYASGTRYPCGTPLGPGISSITTSSSAIYVYFGSPSDVGGFGISSYRLSVSGPVSTSTTSTSSPIAIGGLPGGSYSISLQAGNQCGYGVTSSSAATLSSVPSAPGISSVYTGCNSITTYFTAASANGAAISKYTLCIQSTSKCVSGTGSPLTLTGVAYGTYTVIVYATNSVGNGASASSTTPTVATTPSAPSITSLSSIDGSATVYFAAGSNNGAAITSYFIESIGSSSYVSATTSSSPVVLSSLINGGSYAFRMYANNACGGSGWSSTSS